MNSKTPKTVKVDIYDIDEAQVKDYMADRELCAREATIVMERYCKAVKRETIDAELGEAIVGYYKTGEVLMSVQLDPFETPVMKMAFERGNLESYILAANGFTEENAEVLRKERLD
ncbi:MAG: hypothetical protein KHZ77_00445 [Veillonella sp.]|uniref:hypothetical protein n=1 Tax=Veillonella sp. TaxID=1926307 RepID=UPI0025E8FF9D|nr:hypothetical protein [Veillonella sp.]MBS4912621.1 hypothetical protein [Veillonella sp.]